MVGLILYIFLGAVSGYLTNRWAVKKIFHKYPLIGGAKIIKRRRRMSTQLAKSIEQDILQQHQLFEALEQPSLKILLEQQAELFLEQLPQKALSKLPHSLSTAPQFQLLKANFLAYVHETLTQIVPYLLKGRQLKAEQLFSPAAQITVATNITKFLNAQIEKQKTTESFLRCVKQNFGNHHVSQILPTWVLRKLSHPTEELFSSLFPAIEKHHEQFIQLVTEALKNMQFTKEFNQLSEQLLAKSPEQIYEKSHVDLEEISDLFSQHLSMTFYTHPQLIARLLNTIFQHLSQSKMTLIEIFPLKTQKYFEQYLETVFPEAIEQLMSWLSSKKRELEECVNSSIGQALEKNGNIIEKLQSIILGFFASFIDNIAQHFKIVDLQKIAQALSDPSNPLKQEISKKMLHFLQKQPLGELFYKLQNFSIPQGFSQIIKQRFWQRRRMTQKRASQQGKVENLLPNEALAEQFFKHFDNLIEALEHIIAKNLRPFGKQPLKQTFAHFHLTTLFKRDENDIAEKIYSWLTETQNTQYLKQQFARKKTHFLRFKLESLLPNTLQPLKLPIQLIQELLHGFTLTAEKLQKPLQRKFLQSSEIAFERWSQQPVTEFIYKYLQADRHSAQLGALLHQELKSQAQHFLTSGQLAATIKKRLDGLGEGQLSTLLGNVFEKQLRTVNILGGIFGAVAGFVLFYLPLAWGWQGFFYPLIGWSTNVFAVNYLFMYKYIKGTIAQNLAAFAKRMASFLDKDILNRQAFSHTIPWQKLRWKILQKTNFKNILQFFKRQQDQQEKIIKGFFSDESQQKWAESLAQSSCSQWGTPKASTLLNSLKTFATNNTESMAVSCHNFLEKKESWQDMLTQERQEKLTNTLAAYLMTSVQKQNQDLNSLQWFQLCQPYFSEIYLLFIEKLEQAYRSEGVVEQLHAILLTHNNIHNLASSLNHKVKEFLETHKQEKIASLFDGRLLDFILKEISTLAPQLTSWLINFLKNQRAELKQVASQLYNEKTNLLQKLGGSILGVKGKINRAVDTLLDVELPNFIQRNAYEVEQHIRHFIARSAQKISIDQLLPLDSISLEKPVIKLLNSQQFSQFFRQFLTELRNLLPLKETFLQPLGLAATEDFPPFLKEQFGSFLKTLSLSCFTKERLLPFIDFFWSKALSKQSPALFFSNFSIEDWQKLCAELLEKLSNQASINRLLERQLEQFLHELGREKLEFFIPQEILQQALGDFLERMQENPLLTQFLTHFLKTRITHFIDSCEVLVPLEIQSLLNNFFSEIAIEHLQQHIEEILQNIDIQGVAEHTLAAMEVKNIKKIFYSFAGDIFNSLKRDGFLLGFPPVLLIALFVTSIDEFKKKDSS